MKKVLISIFTGIIMGRLFIRYLYPLEIIHGPNSNQIKEQIYYDHKENKCYQFIPHTYVCPLIKLKS